MKSSDKDNSVIRLIRNQGGEFLKEAAELSIDEIITQLIKNADTLKSLPIVKWIFLGNTIANNIHLGFFLKKYALFIGPIHHEIPETYWNSEEITELLESKGKLEQLIEQTIIAIDRYQTENKAKMLGNLFVKTFKEKLFTTEEYNILLFSIELMHPYLGTKCLKEFYNYKVNFETEQDKAQKKQIWEKGSKLDFSPLSSTSLLVLPRGETGSGNLGGAYLNELGQKFYEEIVAKI